MGCYLGKGNWDRQIVISKCGGQPRISKQWQHRPREINKWPRPFDIFRPKFRPQVGQIKYSRFRVSLFAQPIIITFPQTLEKTYPQVTWKFHVSLFTISHCVRAITLNMQQMMQERIHKVSKSYWPDGSRIITRAQSKVKCREFKQQS